MLETLEARRLFSASAMVTVAPASGAPVAVATGGHTYTVSPTGTLKTIAAAAKLAGPGDTVLIAPGTYKESLALTTSGSAGRPITFKAQTPGETIIDATGLPFAISSNNAKTHDITLDGLVIKGSSNAAANTPAAVDTGSDWTLNNVTVSGAAGTGIDVWGSNITLTDVTAENCGRAGLSGDGCRNVLVNHCTTTGNNTAGNDPSTDGGAGKWVNASHVTVENLNSYNNVGPGLWFDYGNSNILISNCWVHLNKSLHFAYEGEGLIMELNVGPVEVSGGTFSGNVGPQISVQNVRNLYVHNATVKGTYIDLRDWDRGADYTDQNWAFTKNTFKGTQIMATGGTWDDSSTTVKNITFAGNTYTNPPAAAYIWGGDVMTLSQAEAELRIS